MVGGITDLALAGQEDEDVAGSAGLAPQFVDGVRDGVVEAVVPAVLERPPALLDRIQPARNLDHGRRPGGRGEVLREAARVDRRRGHDQLQLRALRQQPAQVAEQEVDVQAALVRLVDDQGVVGAQARVALRLGEQDAVGHQLDRGARLDAVLKAHLVADDLAERRLQLFGDAPGDRAGGDATRLRVADQRPVAARIAGTTAAQLQRDLRQLRGLAGARLAAHDHDLVGLDRLRDFIAPRRDGQCLRKGDRRQRRETYRGRRGGRFHEARIIGERLVRETVLHNSAHSVS